MPNIEVRTWGRGLCPAQERGVRTKADLGSELGAALLLQAAQNGALKLIAGAEVVEQPPGELLAVELREQVLVTDVGQQLDDLVQLLLCLLVTQLLCATLQCKIWLSPELVALEERSTLSVSLKHESRKKKCLQPSTRINASLCFSKQPSHNEVWLQTVLPCKVCKADR